MTEINVVERPGMYEISEFDNLKETLAAYVMQYSNAKFDCDDKQSRQNAKSIMADLRSKRNQIETKRKEIKKRAMEPYDRFAEKCKELTEMIDATVISIDRQLRDWNTEQQTKRKEEIEKKFNELTDESFREIVPFRCVIERSWLNQSTSKTKVDAELTAKIIGFKKDIQTICAYPEAERNYVLPTYTATHDMNAVMLRLNDFRAAVEADRKRREEEEKKKAEEVKPEPVKEPVNREPEFMDIPTEFLPTDETVPADEVKALWFRVEGTAEELEQVRIFLNSLGLPYREREA